MSQADTDADLLKRAVNGDSAALRDLLKRHGGAARGAITGRIDRRWRAVLDEDDVMQVAYMEAFLHIDQLTSRDIRSFVAWLSRIAENALRDAVRGLMRDKRPDPARRIDLVRVGGDPGHSRAALLDLLTASGGTPSAHAAVNEAAANLDQAMERLPTAYRNVIQLYDLEGLSPAEVAERLGRSVGAVHMLRARAHDRLRVEMGSVSRFFSDGS